VETVYYTTTSVPNALARFDRDVLSQSGVKYLIILEGINDIGRFERKKLPQDVISADDYQSSPIQVIDLEIFCMKLDRAPMCMVYAIALRVVLGSASSTLLENGRER
jgi:hypothetical protein